MEGREGWDREKRVRGILYRDAQQRDPYFHIVSYSSKPIEMLVDQTPLDDESINIHMVLFETPNTHMFVYNQH